MRRAVLVVLLALVMAIGCASTGDDGATALADDKKPTEPAPAGKAPEGKGKKDAAGEKTPAPVLAAKVVDVYGEEHDVQDLLFHQPSVSLFGGSEGEGTHAVTVTRGAGDYEVDMTKVSKVEVTSLKDKDKDRVKIKVFYRPGKDRKEKTLEGFVKPNLEVRGKTEFGNITLKLREIKEIRFH